MTRYSFPLPVFLACAIAVTVMAPAAAQGNQSESANDGSVVLLTPKREDPFSSHRPVVYVREALSDSEARQYVHSSWKGKPRPVPQSESLAVLMHWGHSIMTRRRLAEVMLEGYAASGGRRSDFRIDVLAPGPQAAARPVPPAARTAAATPPAREVDPLAKKFGCTACHHIDAELMGPAFRNIASKYNAYQAPADTLFKYLTLERIETGRKAACSFNVPKNDEARALVKWVLAQ